MAAKLALADLIRQHAEPYAPSTAEESAALATPGRLELPDDYRTFLRQFNGCSSENGTLFRIADLLSVTESHPYEDWLPGAIILGDDGGGLQYLLVRHKDQWAYLYVDPVAGERNPPCWIASSCEEFLKVFFRPEITEWKGKKFPFAAYRKAMARTAAVPAIKPIRILRPGDTGHLRWVDDRHVNDMDHEWDVETGKAQQIKVPGVLWSSAKPDAPTALDLPGLPPGVWDPQLARDPRLFMEANRIRYSPDKTRCLVGMNGLYHRLVDLETGKVIRELAPGSARFFSTDGRWIFGPKILFGSKILEGPVFDGRTGEFLRPFPDSAADPVCCDTAGRVLCRSAQKEPMVEHLEIWDKDLTQVVHRLVLRGVDLRWLSYGDWSRLPFFAFLDENRLVVRITDSAVRIVRVSDGQEIVTFHTPREGTSIIAISPNRRWIATYGYSTKGIRIWEVPPP